MKIVSLSCSQKPSFGLYIEPDQSSPCRPILSKIHLNIILPRTSLYSSKILDKKEILRTLSKTGIYCSSDKVGTVYLTKYIFENSTVNINTLRNSCVQCAVQGNSSISVQLVWGHGVLLVCTVYCVLYSEIALSRKPFRIGHIYIHHSFA
jgi:hypothetical protein